LLPFYAEGRETWSPRGVGGSLEVLRSPDQTCRRCDLHKSVGRVCMPSDGAVGGVLLVLPTPTAGDDRAGRMVPTGVALEAVTEVRKHWAGPLRVTWAVRCAAGAAEESAVDACRPYLAAEVEQA